MAHGTQPSSPREAAPEELSLMELCDLIGTVVRELPEHLEVIIDSGSLSLSTQKRQLHSLKSTIAAHRSAPDHDYYVTVIERGKQRILKIIFIPRFEYININCRTLENSEGVRICREVLTILSGSDEVRVIDTCGEEITLQDGLKKEDVVKIYGFLEKADNQRIAEQEAEKSAAEKETIRICNLIRESIGKLE